MDDSDLNSLNRCLSTLKYLFINIDRITPEKEYEEKRGGYGDVQVSTLDKGTLSAKLVVTKTLRLYAVKKRPHRLALRFARELRVWAGLNHPHILSLLGYHLDQNRRKAILVSDYMSYGDLKEYIEDQNPIWRVRLGLARDITDGLSYLHTRTPAICHGDLKMGNILVSSNLHAVVADFGLSTMLEEEGSGLTTSIGLKGTARYYSPELILESDAKHSLQSDIWAWGCLILETLTDIIPYAQKRIDHAVLFALSSEELPANLESLSIPSPELKALLGKCWSFAPADRPPAPTCLEIISKLSLSGETRRQVGGITLEILPSGSSAEAQQRALQIRQGLFNSGPGPSAPTSDVGAGAKQRVSCDSCGRGWLAGSRDAYDCGCDDSEETQPSRSLAATIGPRHDASPLGDPSQDPKTAAMLDHLQASEAISLLGSAEAQQKAVQSRLGLINTGPGPSAPTIGVGAGDRQRVWCDNCGRGWLAGSRDVCDCDDSEETLPSRSLATVIRPRPDLSPLTSPSQDPKTAAMLAHLQASKAIRLPGGAEAQQKALQSRPGLINTEPGPSAPTIGVGAGAKQRIWCDNCGRGWLAGSRDTCNCGETLSSGSLAATIGPRHDVGPLTGPSQDPKTAAMLDPLQASEAISLPGSAEVQQKAAQSRLGLINTGPGPSTPTHPPLTPQLQQNTDIWNGTLMYANFGDVLVSVLAKRGGPINAPHPQFVVWPNMLRLIPSYVRPFRLQELAGIIKHNGTPICTIEPDTSPFGDNLEAKTQNMQLFTDLYHILKANNVGAAIPFDVPGGPQGTGIFVFSPPSRDDVRLVGAVFLTQAIPYLSPPEPQRISANPVQASAPPQAAGGWMAGPSSSAAMGGIMGQQHINPQAQAQNRLLSGGLNVNGMAGVRGRRGGFDSGSVGIDGEMGANMMATGAVGQIGVIGMAGEWLAYWI